MQLLSMYQNMAVVSSRNVASGLNRKHKNVIRDIEEIEKTLVNTNNLIIQSSYTVPGQRRKYPEYLLTKDGFTLYMFNIQGHNDFKLKYIQEFNRMESELNKQKLVQQEPQNLQRLQKYILYLEKELAEKTAKSKVSQKLVTTRTSRHSTTDLLKNKLNYCGERVLTIKIMNKFVGLSHDYISKLCLQDKLRLIKLSSQEAIQFARENGSMKGSYYRGLYIIDKYDCQNILRIIGKTHLYNEIFRAYYEDEVDVKKPSENKENVIKRNYYEKRYEAFEKKFEEKMTKIHRAILKLANDVIDISTE